MLAVSAAADEPSAEQLEFFEKKIRPLLVERCYECHSGDDIESDFRIDSRQAILQGGVHGPAAIPGQLDKSLMILAVNHAIQMDMPPKFKLPQGEIDDLAEWVKIGLPWPDSVDTSKPPEAASDAEFTITDEDRGFWSFTPVRRPKLPAVANTNWIRSPIDHFILARLDTARLAPAAPASRSTLIRRVTFDLTGLPPTVEEIASFVSDNSPDAYPQLVDRLLASPAYGERWGRHWLDVVRYADSNGLDENLAHANAYRYRDYIVRSLNQDKGYDQFLSEQIAGDLMPEETPISSLADRLTATGFLSIGAKMLAEDDPVKMQMDIIDEQISTLAQAFMGITLGCARCHDHKFDPISTADYYALAGIFKSTTTMDNFNVVAQWHERPVADQETSRKFEAINGQIVSLESSLNEQRQQTAGSVIDKARLSSGRYLFAAHQLQQISRLMTASRTFSNEADNLAALDVETIEAEQFSRGTVTATSEGVGAGIGVLIGKPDEATFVEYDLTIETAGLYQLELRYAAATAAPCLLTIDGTAGSGTVANGVTGSDLPTAQFWSNVALVRLELGKHTLRLDSASGFPLLDKLRLIRLAGTVAAVGKDPASEDIVADASGLEDAVAFEAETFSRGNVTRLNNGYGAGIGAIAGPGGRNELEYDISLPRAGTYHLAVRYAAAESRPTRISANDQLVNEAGLGSTTGSWYPDTQKWEYQGSFTTTESAVTLKLLRDGPISHLDRMVMIPLDNESSDASPTEPQILAGWRDLLGKTRDDADHPLSLWHRASRGELPQEAGDQSTPSELLLLADGPLNSLVDIAEQYQRVVNRADQQWKALQDEATDPPPKELPDAVLESFRQLVYGDASPLGGLKLDQLTYPAEIREQIKSAEEDIAALKASMLDVPQAMAVAEGQVENLRIHVRGNHLTLGDESPRGFPQILSENDPPLETESSGRLELARWLTSDHHPLTARVIANRVWRWHFGKALVRSPDNFGKLGQEPTHPQLLDFLASTLRDDDWSLKSLHRMILLSATFQMSSEWNQQAGEIDPDNKLIWRMNRRRLEAEVIRDALLAVGDNLDRQLGGSLLPTKNRGYVTSTANIDIRVYDTRRRSIYLPVVRSALYAMFQVFDFAEPSVPNGERKSTTLAAQALFMMNSKVVMDQSRALAEWIHSHPEQSQSGRIGAVYMRLLGRLPESSELGSCLQYMRQYEQALVESEVPADELPLRSWEGLCRALLASNEFIYLD